MSPTTYGDQPGTSTADPMLDTKDQIDVLTSVLPGVPVNKLKFLLDISRGDANQVSNLFLEGGGLSLSCMLQFMKSSPLCGDTVRKLTIDKYDEHQPDALTQEAFAFYKDSLTQEPRFT